jgi:hypothetical protein
MDLNKHDLSMVGLEKIIACSYINACNCINYEILHIQLIPTREIYKHKLKEEW